MDPRARAADAVAAEVQRQQCAGTWDYERIANIAIDAFSVPFEADAESVRAAIARVEEKLKSSRPRPP